MRQILKCAEVRHPHKYVEGTKRFNVNDNTIRLFSKNYIPIFSHGKYECIHSVGIC